MTDTAQAESPASRLLAAGFTRRLEGWVPPGEDRALGAADAIALLESGDYKRPSVVVPTGGVSALPDELVERMFPKPSTDPPPWLLAQADVIAEATVAKLKPVIRAEGPGGPTQGGQIVKAAAARKRLAEIGGAAPHEARHVAAAMLLGVPVVKATAIPEMGPDGELDVGHVLYGAGRWEYEDVRNRALVTLAGHMGELDDWPPPHPSHPSMKGKHPRRAHNDGALLWKAIEQLGLDEPGYDVLVQEARDLVGRKDFRKLEIGVGYLLEQGYEVGPELCERVREITRKETKTVHASTKADAPGTFTLLGGIRDGADRVADGVFARTIKRWQDSGERTPLCWLETPRFPTLIGSVDPATLRDTGTFAPFFKGSIDLEGDHRAEARHAWTAVKAGAADLKLDYMLLASNEDDGVRTLQELDVTGLTLDPTAEAHALIRKADAADLRQLRRESDRVLFDVAIGGLDLDAIKAARDPEPAVPTMGELREQAKAPLGLSVPPPRKHSAEWFRDDMLRLLDAGTGPSAAGPQRKSTAPGPIATFEVL